MNAAPFNTLTPLQVNALLPTDTFITVMKGLMGNELPSVRRKAMELLNNKLHHRTQWDEQQVTFPGVAIETHCQF